jgi:hypothetical protein
MLLPIPPLSWSKAPASPGKLIVQMTACVLLQHTGVTLMVSLRFLTVHAGVWRLLPCCVVPLYLQMPPREQKPYSDICMMFWPLLLQLKARASCDSLAASRSSPSTQVLYGRCSCPRPLPSPLHILLSSPSRKWRERWMSTIAASRMALLRSLRLQPPVYCSGGYRILGSHVQEWGFLAAKLEGKVMQ